MKREPKKTVGVRIPQDVYNTLKCLAAEDNRSLPSYVRLVLLRHLKQV